MRRWLFYIAISIAVLLAIVVLVGLTIPKAHRASRTVTLPAQPATVFEAVSDFPRYPDWRRDVKSMAVDGNGGVGTLIHEEGPHGSIPYRVEAHEPPSRLVLRIADPSLPFGGTWTYELRASGAGTELTLTEDGEVSNPIFRLMQKLFFSPYDTIDAFLADLQKRLSR
jgi:uncharacterized protein YndB with AHSA1/START domain